MRRYLRIAARWWPIMLIALLVTSGGSAYLVQQQPLVYESTGDFVVRPRAANTADAARAFDTLIRGVEINATYAAIARSDLVRKRAEASLGSSFRSKGLSVSAEVVTGTNIVSVSVRGPNTAGARALATAIMAQTAAYADELRDAYELKPLDVPDLPKDPVAPNKQLTIALGVVLGLMLGAGLAIVGEYLWEPRPVSGEAFPAADDGSARAIDLTTTVPEPDPASASPARHESPPASDHVAAQSAGNETRAAESPAPPAAQHAAAAAERLEESMPALDAAHRTENGDRVVALVRHALQRAAAPAGSGNPWEGSSATAGDAGAEPVS